MTRPAPCRPCAERAATAARLGLRAITVRPARHRVTWPPPTLRPVFPQCHEAPVLTCERDQRWTLWPSSLWMALAAETEDLTLPARTAWTPDALDDMLRRKAAGAVPRYRTQYGGLPGESRAAVVAAYREAGNYPAACRLLDKRGIPTRRGRPWSVGMLRSIVQSAARVAAYQQEATR